MANKPDRFVENLAKMPEEFKAAARKLPGVDAMLKGHELAQKIKAQWSQSSPKSDAAPEK